MDNPPQQSVSERRGQRLAPLDTNFSRPTAASSSIPAPRLRRPRPSELPSNGNAEPESLNPSAKRQSSKNGLRMLFGRDKHTRRSSPDTRLTNVEETQHTVTSDVPLTPSTCATPKTTASSSTPIASPTTAQLRKSPRQRAEASESKSGSDSAWKPPPLFQAYPQAIKHDCLSAPAVSADSILRANASARGNSKDRAAQVQSPEVGDRSAKKKDERKKHFRSLSETIAKVEWTQKIYVLLTTGYILQYSGNGKHDRLPEKVLQLGPKSVAFASDAIPGKHWVLQVSQSSDDKPGAPTESHKPLLSRFGFHRSHPRRFARSFLLVLNSPEEMSSWLLTVRAEIEARGGKKYVTERVFDDGEDAQLRSKPSVRQLVKRDPNRFSNSFLQPQGEYEQFTQGLSTQSRRSSYYSYNRRSMVTSESRSESTSTSRTDAAAPTNITEPSYSNNNGNLSFPESIVRSPSAGSDIARSMSSQDGSTRMQTQSPPVSSPKQRQSMLMYSKGPIPESRMPQPQPASPLSRSASPPAPNFSVPSFSKRFTTRATQNPMSQAPQLSNTARRNDYEANIAAAFPSPPQSPTRSTSSFDLKESTEQLAPARKPLRVSNSDASLGSLAESVQKEPWTPGQAGRIPKPITTTTTQHLASGGDGQQLSQAVNTREPPRSRISTVYSNGHPPLVPNRRKSMPGLAGPPSAPPPNYPLPKLPSPITAKRPDNATGIRSPPPLRSARDRDRRISTIQTQTAATPPAAKRMSSRYTNGFREE